MFYGPIVFEVNLYLFLDYFLFESEEDSAKDESAEVGESKVVKGESDVASEDLKPLDSDLLPKMRGILRLRGNNVFATMILIQFMFCNFS